MNQRNPDVDRWLDEQPEALVDALSRVREIVLETDRPIEESIKWQVPTYAYKGNIFSFTRGAKRHVSLMFHRGAEIPGDHPRLEGEGRVARTMRLADLDAVEQAADDLRAVIASWCDWRDEG